MAGPGEERVRAFGQTVIYSIPELFGYEPPPEVKQFKIDNPVAGFAATAIGSSIPYLGWYKFTKYATRLDDLIEGIGAAKAAKNPFLVKGAQEAARFFPLEAGRVIGNQAVGDSSLGESIGEFAINEALAFGAGGLVGKLGSLGTRTKPSEVSKQLGIATTDPPQMQMRAIYNQPSQIPPEIKTAVDGRYQALGVSVRDEIPELKGQYIGKLAGGVDGKPLEDLFKPTTTWRNNVKVRKLLGGPDKYFKSDDEWQAVLGEGGINAFDLERFSKYPRVVDFYNPEARDLALSKVKRTMTDMGDGWFGVQEVDDGLWTLAKQIPAGRDNHGRLFMVKTDSPDWFRMKDTQIAANATDFNKWVRQDWDRTPSGGLLADQIEGYLKENPARVFDAITEVSPSGKVRATFDRVAGYSGLKKAGRTVLQNEAVQQMVSFIDRSLLPLQHQFGGAKLVKKFVADYREAIEAGRRLGTTMLDGKFVNSGKSLIAESLSAAAGQQRTGGPRTSIQALTKDEVDQLWALTYRDKVPVNQLLNKVGSGEVSEKVAKLAGSMVNEITNPLRSEVRQQGVRFGSGGKTYLMDNYMLPRVWDGHLAQVYEKGGAVKGVVTGSSKQEIERKAKALLDDDPLIKPTGIVQRDSLSPAIKRQMQRTTSGRGSLKGFEHYAEPFDKKDLLKMLERNTYATTRDLAVNATDNLVYGDLTRLQRDYPEHMPAVTDRLKDFKGEAREAEKWVNKYTDQLLAPLLGPSSATKIAEATNSTLYHLTMGWVNLATQIVNTMTPFNSTIPEMMYALNGRMLNEDAVYHVAMGANGPVGTLGVWDAMKAMGTATRKLIKPDEQDLAYLDLAVNDGVITPQFLAEAVGENSVSWSGIKQAWTDRNIPSVLNQFSGVLTTKTEQLSRLMSFFTAIEGAKSIGMKDPNQIYQLAKRITNNSQFRYTQADRAAFMTTPLGSMLGLFKHWPLSFLGNTVKYMGEGINYGNWRPLLWQQGSTWAVGGLSASPLVYMAEGFNNVFSDDSLTQNMYEMFDEEDATALYFGLPSYLGFALTSASSAPGANGIQDITSIFTPVALDRMKYMGMAVGQAYSNWQATRDINPATDPQVLSFLVRAFAPRTLQRLYQSFQDDAINSFSSGYPILKDPTLAQKMYHAAGLPPIEMARKYEVAEQVYRDTSRRRSLTAAHGEAYAQAMDVGDSKQMWDVLQSAISYGLDTGSVMKSAAERSKRGNQDIVQRSGNPEIQFRAMKAWGF